MRFIVHRSLTTLTLLALPSCSRELPKPAGPSKVAARSCSEVVSLMPGASLRASTRVGSNRLRASCLRADAPECIFSLDVAQRSELRIALESSDFDGALALYVDGTTPTELRCVDDVPSGDLHHARLDTSVAPGRYLVVVDGASGETGDFELFAELEPLLPIGAVCAATKPLEEGITLRESTRGGVHLFSATCGAGAQGPEHVHSLSLATPSRVRIRQHAEYDGSLYIRSTCEDASSELACNDDREASGISLLTARLGAGTYYVFSDAYSRDDTGDYTLAYERADDNTAASGADVCGAITSAASLGPGPTEIDTLYGTNALAGSCGGEGAPEVLIPVRVDTPVMLIALLEQAEFNAVLYVRRVCEDAQTELACHAAPPVNRTGGELESSAPALVVSLPRGSYTLVIDGAGGADLGAVTLRVLFASPTL